MIEHYIRVAGTIFILLFVAWALDPKTDKPLGNYFFGGKDD